MTCPKCPNCESDKTDYRGKYLIRVRKDGTILLPKELDWKVGEMIEISEYGFKGKAFMLHLDNQYFRNRELAKEEGGQCPKCGAEMGEAMVYNIYVCNQCKKYYTIEPGHEEKVK